jgi:hypothetical protein
MQTKLIQKVDINNISTETTQPLPYNTTRGHIRSSTFCVLIDDHKLCTVLLIWLLIALGQSQSQACLENQSSKVNKQ